MKRKESQAQIFTLAFESLSKAEKRTVIDHLLDDETLRQDILDIALIRERQDESGRPFREYLRTRLP